MRTSTSDKKWFQPSSINISTIKVLKDETIMSRLNNLKSYIWIRYNYCYRKSFSHFLKADSFEVLGTKIIEKIIYRKFEEIQTDKNFFSIRN